MSPRTTAEALSAAGRPLRRLVLGMALVATIGGAAVVLAAASWSARVGAFASPWWVPAAWIAVLLLAAGVVLVARARLRDLRGLRFAERLERAPGWRRGAVRGLLESAGAGTSEPLRAAADAAQARDIADRAPEVLAPELRRLARMLALAGGIALLAGGLAGAAGTRRGPAALLWRPDRALAMLASPLRLRADRPAIASGDSAAWLIAAPGRRQVTLWTRSRGTTWRAESVALDSTGRARRSTGPLDEELFAHITAGSRSSDTVAIAVRRPAFLASLALTLRYPAYLHLEDEPAPAGGDTLLLPAGTRIEAAGEATVPLASAEWTREGRAAPASLEVRGTRFGGVIAPAGSGAYRLAIRTAAGETLGGDVRLSIRVLPDLAPVLDIPVPGGDTTASGPGPVQVVVDAADDHGLTEVVLERRLQRGGSARALPDLALALPAEAVDRAVLPAPIDPSALGLLPGDTLRLAARARDNSPARQQGRSREVAIIIPTRPELRVEERDRAAAIARQLDSLVRESRNAQRQSEDLGRAQQRNPDASLDFDAAKKAEGVAARQEQLLKEAEAVRQSLDQLRQAAERAGLSDSVFLQRLREVQEQLDQALTPELRRQLAELQEALKALDRDRTRDAVRQLGEAQQKLREALERSRELFKRAALEGELASLEQETRELAETQRDWNQRVAAADSAQAAQEERGLSRRADSVASGLSAAARQLDKEARKAAMEQAAEAARAAAGEMRRAASGAEQRKQSEAKSAGERAAAGLSKAQQQVQEQREGQQQEWRAEVIAQLDRALLETTRLAERQLQVSGQYARSGAVAAARGAQGALEEGVQKLMEQIGAASGKNALVSPQILAALAEARQQMQHAREAAASAASNPREAVERAGDAVDALNVAAFGLLRSRDDVAGAGSGSGFAEAMERMTRLAKQQGQLSQDANGMLPLMGSGAIQQQLQSLAARQRALAQELERLRAQGQVDAKPLGDEADELARQLEQGRLDREMVTRQERLFRRMLDAGRTLQGREEDERKERQSETAKPGEIHLPAALRAELLGRDGTIRLPNWEQLQRLSPEERRLVTDYFRRLTGLRAPP